MPDASRRLLSDLKSIDIMDIPISFLVMSTPADFGSMPLPIDLVVQEYTEDTGVTFPL